jgi:signal transduction histidine kinase/ActR/RegA family two-component response regulator
VSRVATREQAAQPVLILAPTGRDAAAAADLLEQAGMLPKVCADLAALSSGLEEAAAVFVAEEALIGRPLDALVEWVERQAAWSDLPFVMLTSRHDHRQVAAWRQQQVDRLGNVALLERPVQPITLVSVMRTALRARKRQLEIQALLRAREAAAAGLEEQVRARTAQLQDVNERLRHEMDQRARIEASLRHAQKLEALGQLTGGVAHDFNNLLMVISAGLEMLERHDDPARRERLATAMRQATERGAALTRQLLTFSRSHALRPEQVHLSDLIGDMNEMLDRSLRGDVEVQVRLAPDLWPVFVDPGELELAILNLAVNARDAMDGSGRITIAGENTVEMDARGGQAEYVRLAVRDTGAGMSEAVQARVFEPFFTTKDVGKGSGLGLAQVYGFAKQSGGRVSIDSVEGQGTTINLLLPRSRQGGAAQRIGAPEARATDPVPGECVLLVEDDAEVATLVEDMLRSIGYDVVLATSATAALGALANGRRIDLVFSDVMMPGGTNGIELAREVRRRRTDLPVLLTSGFAESALGEAAELGIPVLRKPYGIDELRTAVRGQLRSAMAS